jgi:hypothetical protein
MQDRVPTKPNRALIRPEDGGSAFYATITRADEPTQPGDPLNKATLLKDETAALFGLDPTATPDNVFRWLGEWGQANWKLLAEYNTAGAFTFIVPDDVDELGVFILGGGSSGGAATLYKDGSGYNPVSAVSGGASGGLKQVVLKKANGDFDENEVISGVVGAGGIGGTATKNSSVSSVSGGTSVFKGIFSEDGQSPDVAQLGIDLPAPYGFTPYFSAIADYVRIYTPLRENPLSYGGRNIFDENDTHIYCGAGGCAVGTRDSNTGAFNTQLQAVIARTQGSAGAGAAANGGNATAPGDGGGAAVSPNGPSVGGNGSDGLVLVYGRKVV